MCIICKTKDINELKGLKRLDCSYCPNITRIPYIKSLQSIDCFN